MTDTSVADTANPNPAPDAGSAAAALNSPPPSPAFYESFQDPAAKEYAAKAGWKSPEDVVKLAQKFDPFKDADPASLALKPKADDPNDFVKFAREQLGAPTEPTAYGLDKLEGVDAGLAGAAQSWFHEAGLTPFQAQHIAAKQMAFMKEMDQRAIAEEKAAAERELTQLDIEWNTEATAKKELGRRALKAAAQHAGVDPTAFLNYIESGAGAGAAIKMAAFFGQFIKEGDFVDGATNDSKPLPLAERMYADIP